MGWTCIENSVPFISYDSSASNRSGSACHRPWTLASVGYGRLDPLRFPAVLIGEFDEDVQRAVHPLVVTRSPGEYVFGGRGHAPVRWGVTAKVPIWTMLDDSGEEDALG